MEGDTVYTACPTHAVCDRNQALAPTQEPARWKKAGVAAGVDFRQILLSNWNVCNPMFLKSLLQNPNCHVWYIFLLCSLEKLHWANALQNPALQHEKYLCTESVRVEGEELSGTPGQACNRRATRGPSSLRRKLPSTAARAGGRAPARSVAAVCV